MIANIERGSDFLGCSNYILDDEKDAVIIGGNLSGVTAIDMAEELNAIASQRPEIKKPVWHSSLSAVPGEKISDEKWNEVAQDYMKCLGFDLLKTPYMIVRHQDKPYEHIHIEASRVAIDRSLYLGRNENLKATKISKKLEKKHGLIRTKGPGYDMLTGKIIWDEDLQSTKPLTPGERKMSERAGKTPPRQRLQEIIACAVTGRPTQSEYETRLTQSGVVFKLSSNGYSYQIDGIPFKGSQLGTAYKWAQIQKQFTTHVQAELQALHAARRTSWAAEAIRRSKYRANWSVAHCICQISHAILPRPLGEAVQVAADIIRAIAVVNGWHKAHLYKKQVGDLTVRMNQIKVARAAKQALPQDIVMLSEPPKSVSTPCPEIKVEKKQDVEITLDTIMLTGLRTSRGKLITTIPSDDKQSLEPEVQSTERPTEALPPVKETNSTTQQHVFDVPPNYQALSVEEKQEHFKFLEVMQKNYPTVKIETLDQLCIIASDMKKLTIQNANRTLPDEKYNTLTDHQEKQVLSIIPVAAFLYATGQPAIVIDGHPVPEIAKRHFNQPQQPGTPTQGITRTRGKK